MDDLPLHPIWREALRRWPEYGYTWGDIIPHKWFFEVFDLPEIIDTMTVKQAQAIELKMLRYRTEFERALRAEYRMDLVSVPGKGYEIVTPGEQSRRAYDDFQTAMKRASRDLAERLRYINVGMLSDDERRENANLLARAGSIARWIKQAAAQLTHLLPGEDEEG